MRFCRRNYEVIVLMLSFWGDALAPINFAPKHFGANTVERRRFDARRFGAESFGHQEVLASRYLGSNAVLLQKGVVTTIFFINFCSVKFLFSQ